ncbi:MAG TPA: tetratricopeptide repeat protein [Pyrinomonadaceae bacterium]
MRKSFNAIVLTCFALAAGSVQSLPPTQKNDSPALELIRQRRYDDAINRLEQILETKPDEPEALTYLATAQMYADKDFLKAQKAFEAAFRAGGGASFFVNHSHEILGGNDLADYCRGWLHLRKDGVRFVPTEGEHGFSLAYSGINECQRNRWSKSLFHIKYADKNLNFRGRTGDESEALLIVALFKKFAR